MKRSHVELSDTESDQEFSKDKKGQEKTIVINSQKGNKVLATQVENINDSSSDSEKSKGDKDSSNMPEPEKLREDDKKIRVKNFKPFTGIY